MTGAAWRAGEPDSAADALAALLKAGRGLAALPDLERVLQTTTDAIAELMDLKSAAVYLLKKDTLVLGATTPALPRGFPERFRHAPLADHPHVGKAVASKLPVFLPDTDAADLTDAERAVAKWRGLRSVLYLPLIAGEDVIGTLIVAAVEEPRVLSQTEIEACRTLANLAALAVENAQLLESTQHHAAELERRAMELATLNELARRIDRTLSLEEMLSAVADDLVAVTEADAAFVMLRDGEVLDLVSFSPLEAADSFAEMSAHRVRECICGLAVAERKAIYSSDLFTDPRCTLEECKLAGFRSIAALPLRSKDEVFGVMGLVCRTERDFESRSGFLETVASQVSVGVRNAHLYSALMDSEARFRQLADNAPELIYRYRLLPEAGMEYVNRAVADVTGYAREDFLGDPGLFARIAHPDDRPAQERLLSGDASADPVRLRWIRKDGRTIWVEVHQVAYHLDERVAAVEGIVCDVTRAHELAQAKDDFSAMLSHELRTPLTAIIGYSTVLLRDDLRCDRDSCAVVLGRILARADEMQRMVDDLLISRTLERGSLPLHLSRVDLAAVVRGRAEVAAHSQKHRVVVRAPKDDVFVVCDPERVGHAVTNLVSNAVKFSPGGGRITATVRTAGDRVRVSVTDHGVGIPAADRGRIFDRYAQGDMSATRRFGGFGIGLHTVKAVAEAHGGTVTVRSSQGKGSTFVLELPVKGPEGRQS